MNPTLSQGPLAGVRVLDWTHVLAGPFAGYMLGQMGADVIRFERIDQPEMIRNNSLDPLLAPLGLGEGFVMQGSGKRSIGGDIRDPASRPRSMRCSLLSMCWSRISGPANWRRWASIRPS